LRLIQLDEDMPEYHRRMQSGWAKKNYTVGGEQAFARGRRFWFSSSA